MKTILALTLVLCVLCSIAYKLKGTPVTKTPKTQKATWMVRSVGLPGQYSFEQNGYPKMNEENKDSVFLMTHSSGVAYLCTFDAEGRPVVECTWGLNGETKQEKQWWDCPENQSLSNLTKVK